MPTHKGGASHARDPASFIAISLVTRGRAGRCARSSQPAVHSPQFTARKFAARKLAARKLAVAAHGSHPESREPGRCNYISSQTLWANSTGSSGKIPSTSSAWS